MSRTFLSNLRGIDLKITYSATEYTVPSKGIYVDEWKVPPGVVEHALATYSSMRPPTGARERQKPAQKWLDLEFHPDNIDKIYEKVKESR